MESKKVDNVVDKPNLTPYPTNVGAPQFVPTDIESWKGVRVRELNHNFEDRYREIQTQFNELKKDVDINTILYTSKYGFEPKIGETYYLYLNDNDESFLSLIGEGEWGRRWRPKTYLGSYSLDWKGKWTEVIGFGN